MDPFDSSVDDHNRGEVGVGVARHVYGPANVHLLPCKIHHTGEDFTMTSTISMLLGRAL